MSAPAAKSKNFVVCLAEKVLGDDQVVLADMQNALFGGSSVQSSEKADIQAALTLLSASAEFTNNRRQGLNAFFLTMNTGLLGAVSGRRPHTGTATQRHWTVDASIFNMVARWKAIKAPFNARG